jgi:Tol biopolymer transport system component
MTAIDRESGLSQIWRIGYPDGAERRLTDDLQEYKDLTVTADGRTLLVQSLRHLTQLWITAGADGSQAKQIASGTAQGTYDALAWTSDSALLYRWSERGVHEMWRMAADGREQHQLTVDAGEVADTSAAPNGQFVFFVSMRSGSHQIWRMTPDGEGLRQLTHLKALVSSPIASADGQSVYFTTDERGFLTLWKMPIDGQSVSEVSDQAIELFDLSPDGKWLAYSYRDSDRKCLRVAVVALDGTAPARYFDIEPTFALRWTPDGRGLAFTHEQGNIWIQPVNGGSPYALTQVHPSFKVVTFAWSPGGRYLAYTLMADPVDAIAFKLK